jgi:hypothetical protein
MSRNNRKIFVSHSAKDTKLIRLIRLTFANRAINPYFASRKIEGRNPVEKILKAIAESIGLFALITPNVVNETYTRDWVVFEIGAAKAIDKPIFCWIDKKVANSESYPKLLENLTDYDKFDSEEDEECCRVAEAIREKAFELPILEKSLGQIQRQIERDFDKREEHGSTTDTALPKSKKTESQKTAWLPDETKIADLNITANLLSQFYNQALKLARTTFEDALPNNFCIQVFPFLKTSNVNIYLNFYSKWADRICSFSFHEILQEIQHNSPDKLAKEDEQRVVSTTLPWEYSPNWQKFLKKVIAKIGDLPKHMRTMYHLHAHAKAPDKWTWDFVLDDCFNDKTHRYEWNGKEVDDSNIKKLDD